MTDTERHWCVCLCVHVEEEKEEDQRGECEGDTESRGDFIVRFV